MSSITHWAARGVAWGVIFWSLLGTQDRPYTSLMLWTFLPLCKKPLFGCFWWCLLGKTPPNLFWDTVFMYLLMLPLHQAHQLSDLEHWAHLTKSWWEMAGILSSYITLARRMHPTQNSRKKSCWCGLQGWVENQQKHCCGSSDKNILFSQMQRQSLRALLQRHGDRVMAIILVPGWENGKEAFGNYHSVTTKHMQAA